MQKRVVHKSLRAEPLEDRLMLTVPDFGLIDTNPASASFGDTVRPSQYFDVSRVTAWYFGHST